MRWSIIRLIWFRELKDQLRDRRTIFMIAVLPVLIYPIAGFGLMQVAVGFLSQRNSVGVVGMGHLDPWRPPSGSRDYAASVAWLGLASPAPGGTAAFPYQAAILGRAHDRLLFPPLLEVRKSQHALRKRYLEPGLAIQSLAVVPLDIPVPATRDPVQLLAQIDRTQLDERRVDVLLVIPADFQSRLDADDSVDLYIVPRPKDEISRLVTQRLTGILGRWRNDLKDARLARRGLPAGIDQPLRVVDPRSEGNASANQEENIFALLARIFPFILVMWSLAGALYPAVDLCAGEKERGTMETLLISPAGRKEIVWGKFLTIWVFSAATALLNLLSMAITTWQFASSLPGATLSPWALFWGVVLLLPLSAFFSALCLAVGAYARSTKEGQYYLMPLFLVTMPLIFLTLAPGVELNPFYSMVPVTGVALLLQRLIANEAAEGSVWLYFVPVLVPMVVYSWLALRWAIAQFQREEVLFREAERLDLGLWLKRLLRDKESLPSAGEAIFCFAMLLVFRWVSLNVRGELSLLARTGIGQLAFVATPPMIMAVLLTTRPLTGLGLQRAAWWSWPTALLLAVCTAPPLAELTLLVLQQFPGMRALMELNHPLTSELRAVAASQQHATGPYFFVLGCVPAVCEELAFRGFILTGLRRSFKSPAAILLSAFLFALYQMNVFQFLPHFAVGILLGLIVVRTGSVLPAILFHLVYNCLVLAPAVEPAIAENLEAVRRPLAIGGALVTVVVVLVLSRLGKRGGSQGDVA